MTQITSKAREAQRESFGDDVPQEVVDSTLKVYEMIDALNDPQRRLLVGQALTAAHNALRLVVDSEDRAIKAAYATVLNGFVAIAGYANETLRETLGETSTGDSAITEVLEHYMTTTRMAASAGMSPELQAEAEALANEAVERCARTGENENDVLLELIAARRARQAAGPKAESVTVSNPSRTTEDSPGYGLYL